MPRGPRLTLDNAIFHIINRGNGRQEVFHDEKDFETFLSVLAHYKDIWGFKMYNFCLMPNHFHLLWEIQKAETLSRAMQAITLSYSRAHHARYKTAGYLWQGRFKNMIIEKDNYLLSCGAYIERNPKRAGLVARPEEWRWSSYRFYAFGEPIKIPIIKIGEGKKLIELIDENPLYKDFGKSPGERQRNYRDFVIEMDNEETKEKFSFRDKGILGGEVFKKKLEEMGLKVEAGRRGRPPRQ